MGRKHGGREGGVGTEGTRGGMGEGMWGRGVGNGDGEGDMGVGRGTRGQGGDAGVSWLHWHCSPSPPPGLVAPDRPRWHREAAGET